MSVQATADQPLVPPVADQVEFDVRAADITSATTKMTTTTPSRRSLGCLVAGSRVPPIASLGEGCRPVGGRDSWRKTVQTTGSTTTVARRSWQILRAPTT